MYIDIEKTEVTKSKDGEIREETSKYDKVFLAKVHSSLCFLAQIIVGPAASTGYLGVNIQRFG